MGEAKRRRDRACPCGSGKRASDCCFSTGKTQTAAPIALTRREPIYSHLKCYLRQTGCCSEKISGEHPLSKSVLKTLNGGVNVFVKGFHWQPAGEEKPIGINSLTANVLCDEHNSALTDLDETARSFFEAIRVCQSRQTKGRLRHSISGHDIERWMLKAMAGLAEAGAFRDDAGNVLLLDPRIDVPKLLTNPSAWKHPHGLYMVHKVGDAYPHADTVELVALSKKSEGTVVGMVMRMRGMQFMLFLNPTVAFIEPILVDTWYRPCELRFSHSHTAHQIKFYWFEVPESLAINIEVHASRPPGVTESNVAWPSGDPIRVQMKLLGNSQ